MAALLRLVHPDLEVTLVEIDTSGDRDRSSPVAALTEMGAFVRSVQQAVLDGTADAAVHSLKDMPTAPVPGLTVAAYPERRDPWDVLVGADLDDLPPGALVGTGSPRRVAQLMLLRPDLETTELRGNVDTRLRKVADGEVAAAVLAAAGLARLDRADSIRRVFGVGEMVPAPGQGALAVETAVGTEAAELVAAIDDPAVRGAVAAERLLLAETGAGCRSALGAIARANGESIMLHAFVADERGPRRATVTGDGAAQIVAAAVRELGL